METGTGAVKRGWVYNLTKEQLISWLHLLEAETDGNIDELRKRMSLMIATQPDRFRLVENITYSRHNHEEPAQAKKVVRPRSTDTFDMSDVTKTVNQMRKWGCQFDGRDPIAFLERIEELQEMYGVDSQEMLTGLPELLKNEALMWYRNHKNEWTEWEEFTHAFKQEYLPQGYRSQLLRHLRERKQGENEPYARYATQVMTLMRRAGRLTLEEQIDKLYDGMKTAHKKFIRKNEIKSITELSTRAKELEEIDEESKTERSLTKEAGNIAATSYSSTDHCWRCKQRGHTSKQCKRPSRLFCMQCGKDGIATKDCHPRSGNETRAGNIVNTARPQPKQSK